MVYHSSVPGSNGDQDQAFRRLLLQSLAALALGAILVTFCYFLVDRQVAFFVFEHHWNQIEVLKWLTYPPPYLEALAPVVLVALLVRRAWGPFLRWEQVLLAVCVSLLLAVQLKNQLKFAFGRTWPDTWIRNNPSLLQDGVYGFFPFRHGDWKEADWYASFPSGHTTRVLAIVSVVWIAYPGWRWACVLAALITAISLVGMDYHFVGDVIAGGFVGGIVGAYVAQFCRVSEVHQKR